MKYRIEYDSMGEVPVPEDAYYGAQTQRAMENFAVSGLTFPSSFIRAIGMIKKHAASVNRDLGLLPKDLAEAIIQAATETAEGKFDNQFVLDVFQTGSGTSTNMNANEVIAARANEILTGKRGGKSPVHPNDHVNKCQSSNDVIPTAIHLAALVSISKRLIPGMESLRDALQYKAHEFDGIRKIGRTHLQDAVPIRLGDEFSGYARQLELAISRIYSVEKSLGELALGGTAVGTGLQAHSEFAPRVIALISEETGCSFREAVNHFEAQAAQDAAVETSGALKTLAVSLMKIANDIRWLASGPRCGIGEINIPSLQPGSSIMPGKVNPVIPEMVIQVAAQVIANDTAITLGGQWGTFELNTMLPLIAYNLLHSINLLEAAVQRFALKCVNGITANSEKCRQNIEQSLAMATALNPAVGYEQAAAIAQRAYKEGKTVREIALEEKKLPEDEISRLLDDAILGPHSE
ncbi:MAG: class II fumarate hydratase [Desulfomonile tiedjei]|uniref:Fumarate hydratase class II n=1 Tax=Desulfomonile tiedjei TaxID=2358 RepID=A0A9D6V3V0_9BACT|nr:class II fumarate hydratase [Desulfomonile tiedjei]